ncbi:MAG: hypothetical protein ACR2PX_00675, partial [Endozoicomonas sp.]|uniref:hypothetical protein n=1 Tax=Endozoicomonas sp. TaxID=1892382 RepID=UPI003D9B0C7D
IDLLRLFYPSLANNKKSKPYSVGFMHSGGEKPLSNQEITDSGTRLRTERSKVRQNRQERFWTHFGSDMCGERSASFFKRFLCLLLSFPKGDQRA